MRILVEGHTADDLTQLDRAWSETPTFAFVPPKSGVGVEWVERALGSLPPDLREGHFALLTSGSTGAPKLVVGARARAEALAKTLHEIQESEPVAETVVSLPLSYCYAFVNQWLWSRVLSRRLVQTRGIGHADELGDALRKARNAMLCLVGTQAGLLVEVFARKRFEGVTRLHFAGGAFPQGQLDALREIFPRARVFNNYGCAEAMPRLTVRRAQDGSEASDVGRPIEGVELRSGESGQLEFRSVYGAVAFFDEDRFRRVEPGEWLPTGDLGQVDDRGHWHVRGRANEVFKRHGEKIALPLLLQSLQPHWRGAAAFYRERDTSGEEGHVLILAPHPRELEVRELQAVLRARHARAQWPLRIESVDALPTLANGKIDVTALPGMSDKVVHWRQRI